MKEVIREVLRKHGRDDVDVLNDDSDLYLAGMTSHATVNVMLGLENAFEIEFPDQMLRRSVFESIHSIEAAITSLRSDATRMAG